MSYTESWSGKINRKLLKKLHIIDVAAGREKADLVLKNATYVNVFSNELCQGGRVQLVGFGSFEVKERAARTGKNPATGEQIDIPASKAPAFKAGKAFKDAIQ